MTDRTINLAAAIEEIEAIVDTMSVCISMDECKGMRRMKQSVLEKIKALPPAQPEPEEFEWCHTCREYDQEKHCCHRWTKVIRQTVEDMKAAQPGWIPVTEKPIEGGQYIVTLKDDKEVWTDIAEWNPTFGGRWQAEFFDCEYRDIDNVLAWMPLPEPWKGGQE